MRVAALGALGKLLERLHRLALPAVDKRPFRQPLIVRALGAGEVEETLGIGTRFVFVVCATFALLPVLLVRRASEVRTDYVSRRTATWSVVVIWFVVAT